MGTKCRFLKMNAFSQGLLGSVVQTLTAVLSGQQQMSGYRLIFFGTEQVNEASSSSSKYPSYMAGE